MTRHCPVEFAEGGIANEHGDLFGTSPFRIIRHGKLVIAAERVMPALMMGWRLVEKHGAGREGADNDFGWIERTAEEREAVCS